MLPERIADVPSPLLAHEDTGRRPRGPDLLPAMLRALDNRGWVAARILAEELGTNDRSIREAANRSAGHVLGGRRGYSFTTHASLREVSRVTRVLLGQSSRMRQRVIEIERVRHTAPRREEH